MKINPWVFPKIAYWGKSRRMFCKEGSVWKPSFKSFSPSSVIFRWVSFDEAEKAREIFCKELNACRLCLKEFNPVSVISGHQFKPQEFIQIPTIYLSKSNEILSFCFLSMSTRRSIYHDESWLIMRFPAEKTFFFSSLSFLWSPSFLFQSFHSKSEKEKIFLNECLDVFLSSNPMKKQSSAFLRSREDKFICCTLKVFPSCYWFPSEPSFSEKDWEKLFFNNFFLHQKKAFDRKDWLYRHKIH